MLTERTWRLETVPYLLVGLFISVCLGSAVMSLMGVSSMEEAAEKRFLVLLANALFVHGVILGMIAYFLRANQTGWAAAFGFGRGPVLRQAAWAAGALLIILPAAWALSKWSMDLIHLIGGKPEAQMPVVFLQSRPPWQETAFVGFSTILLAPVVEEMLFRGLLYPSVKRAGFPKTALLAIAFLFAAFHSNLMTFVPLFMLGLVLAMVYEATDNLLAPILLHSFFNAANFLVLIFDLHPEQLLNRLW